MCATHRSSIPASIGVSSKAKIKSCISRFQAQISLAVFSQKSPPQSLHSITIGLSIFSISEICVFKALKEIVEKGKGELAKVFIDYKASLQEQSRTPSNMMI